MKDLFTGIASATVLFVVSVCSAQADESDAIKSVIRSETESFYKRDADGWQAAWSHDAKATRTLASKNSYNSVTGWESFGPSIIKFLRQADAVPIEFKNDNFTMHVGDRVAWVQYDQTMTLPGTNRTRLSREHRALVKVDGKWRIVSQITHDLPWQDGSN